MSFVGSVSRDLSDSVYNPWVGLLAALLIAIVGGGVGWFVALRKMSTEIEQIEAETDGQRADAAMTIVNAAEKLVEPLRRRIEELERRTSQLETHIETLEIRMQDEGITPPPRPRE